MIRLTASSLARVEKCPASASLPQIDSIRESAERGTALHAEREREDPEGAEVAFALDVRTGEARELGRRLGRAYVDLAPDEIAGTLDKLKVEPGRVVVRDFKSGFGAGVAPAARNIQLGFGAVAAARAHGRDAARVEIEYLDQDGRIDGADLDAFDMAEALARIRAIHAQASAQAPRVVAGDHCGFCPAVRHCPAHREVLMALGNGMAESMIPTVEVDADLIARAWPIRNVARRALAMFDAAAEAYVATCGPVALADGRVLALRAGEREGIDGAVAHAVLLAAHGPAVANAAVEMTTTKTAIEAALAPIAPPRGKAALVRAALEAIRAAGGTATKPTKPKLEAVNPERALPAPKEAADAA